MAEVLGTWRVLNFEQRVTVVGALLLVVSTFGPFSFVEAAELLIAAALLALLYARAQGKRFHLPFGDGTVILAAGVWAACLITARVFDRPLGQNLLAIVCSGNPGGGGCGGARQAAARRHTGGGPPRAAATLSGAASARSPRRRR